MLAVSSTDDLQRSVRQRRDIGSAVRAGDHQLAAAAIRSRLLAACYIALQVS